jgi:DNA-binding winged helix-turn-helix (wHTH) protein/tetratricopeptide (TPR) repeat protein/TolB-like protein
MNRPAPWRSIMTTVVERQPFTVGGATVEPISREASWPGGKERLQPQTLKVLMTLVSRRGEVVTRDELVQLCWDGRAVSDDVINRAILLLRHLAEHAGGFQIETVPRTGYRLVENGSSERATRWSSRPRLIAGGVAVAIGVAALAGWAWIDRKPASQGLPPTPNVSVVPFAAQTNDPLVRQVALNARGSLAHMLSESGFIVVRDEPSKTPGPNDYIFSGTVRRSATSIDATVQMVSKRDGTIAYTHDFSAPLAQAVDLPDRIGATAAAELAWTGAEMILDPREHLSPEIASELMKAITLTIEDHDDMRAYQLNRHAAELAPNSAFPQLALAIQTGFSIASIPHGERRDAVALALRSSERARQLAPEFGDVYLTWCLLHSPVRMTECDTRVHHALEVDSISSFVPGYLSSLYYNAGRMDEALQLARQSLANDPYKPAKLARMIWIDEATGDSGDADRVYREATRLWPDGGRMRFARALGMAERGDYADLTAFADSANDPWLFGKTSFPQLMNAQRSHDLGGAQRTCSANGVDWFTQGLCMTILADLGDRDRAFAIAATLYPAWHAPAGQDPDQFWLDHPDGYDTSLLSGQAARSLRADPRFLDLASKLGLLTYWRARRLPDFCTKDHEPVCAQISRR